MAESHSCQKGTPLPTCVVRSMSICRAVWFHASCSLRIDETSGKVSSDQTHRLWVVYGSLFWRLSANKADIREKSLEVKVSFTHFGWYQGSPLTSRMFYFSARWPAWHLILAQCRKIFDFGRFAMIQGRKPQQGQSQTVNPPPRQHNANKPNRCVFAWLDHWS